MFSVSIYRKRVCENKSSLLLKLRFYDGALDDIIGPTAFDGLTKMLLYTYDKRDMRGFIEVLNVLYLTRCTVLPWDVCCLLQKHNYSGTMYFGEYVLNSHKAKYYDHYSYKCSDRVLRFLEKI